MAQLYKGLASYQESEAGQFKGRTIEIQEMYDNFLRNEYLVCYADSGEGKSSIIEAGLIPKLRQGCYQPVRILFEDKDFKNENIDFDKFVCDAIYKEIECLKADTSIQVDVVYPKKLINTNETLEWEKQLIDSVAWLRLRYSVLTIDNLVFTPVLIFDQFEEIFTNPQSQEWTNRFFAWLQELSMDLCPKRIVEIIKKHVGGEFFSEISTNKLYKAIFSLRSEYIGQLDYWGIQKYYIPILKSNRYLLRPLTIEGAREVITQQNGYNGLDDVAEEIIDAIRQSQKGKNYVENNSSDLPCIPALFLSVICSKAYGMSEQERSAFIGKLKGEKPTLREDALNEIIEDFYNEAISACEIPERDLEVIENVLVNSEGVRQRISSESDVLKGISFSKNYQEKLKDARLIRVISEYNRVDKIIELIHDCLCDIVLRRKKIRHEDYNQRKIKETEEKAEKARLEAEEALRRKKQTEDLTSSFFLLTLFLFVAWLLYSVYQDKETFMSLLDLNGDKIANYKEQLLFTMIVSNLAILPILIYSAVKKLKITAWLSIYGLLSNAVLFYFFFMGQNEQIEIRVSLGVVAIGVSFVTLLYSYVFHIVGLPTKDDFRKLFNSIPLTIFFLALSIYLFYLCIFNDAIGLPGPSDSSWGVLIIPLLTHELFRVILIVKRHWLAWGIYILLLGLMAYNTIEDHPVFKGHLAMAIVLCLILVLLWLHYGLRLKKKAIAVISQAAVIIVILILNLGFNPLKVNYDSVVGIYNWKEISVKGRDNHFGIVEACTGDTLLPCVFDSLRNNKEYFACLSTNKIQHSNDIKNYNGRYSYSKETGFAKYQNQYLPSTEQITYKIANKKKLDNTLTDTISYYAAKAYFESRNASISLLLGGGELSLEKIPSLELLYKYQLKELDEILRFGNENLNSIGFIDGNWTVKLNRSFARTFYLCLLRDRIVKEDFATVFSLCQEILPLYFYDLMNDNINITTTSTYNITFGEFYKSYVTRIVLSNIRKEGNDRQIESWYNYIEFFTYLDISLNAESYSSSMEEIIADIHNKIEVIENNMRKKDNTLSKLKHLTEKDNLSADQVMEAIKLAVNGFKEVVSVREQFKNTTQFVSERLSKLEEERIQIDMEFRNMINNVFLVLPSVVTETSNVFNANFSNICELLYLVAAVRLYDMSSVYLQSLENMDGAKMKTYIEFKKTQEEKTKMLQKVRKMAKKLNR